MPKTTINRKRLAWLAAGLVAVLALLLSLRFGASDGDARKDAPLAEMGLMTGLPLYWPLGSEISNLIDLEAEPPWQRDLLEQRFELRLLDTLAPVSEANQPLANLKHLAVIQPRGLSPQDNVALDEWVRDGGRLLIVLDPALTGEYDVPLGDPRMPPLSVLIPPVIERWGLAMTIDYSPDSEAPIHSLPTGQLPVEIAGRLHAIGEAGDACDFTASSIIARCAVGAGYVTVLADAAVFEHRELAGTDGEAFDALFNFAFSPA